MRRLLAFGTVLGAIGALSPAMAQPAATPPATSPATPSGTPGGTSGAEAPPASPTPASPAPASPAPPPGAPAAAPPAAAPAAPPQPEPTTQAAKPPPGPTYDQPSQYRLVHNDKKCASHVPCTNWTVTDEHTKARFDAVADLRPLHLANRLATAAQRGNVTLFVNGVATSKTEGDVTYTVVRATKLLGSTPKHPLPPNRQPQHRTS